MKECIIRRNITYKKVVKRMLKKALYNKYVLAVVILSLILTIISFFMITTTVSANTPITSKKLVTSVLISRGDTLWSIASEYITEEYKDIPTYIKEIKRTNGLDSDNITEGCYLIVPYYISNAK